MDFQMAITIRQKKLGLLLRDARVAAGKKKSECAEVIGVSTTDITSIEQGERGLSMPELERLSYFFQVPFSHFWKDDILSTNKTQSVQLPENHLRIRDREIGKLIAEARQKKEITYEEVENKTGITTSRIQSFEAGEIPIPIPELEMLCHLLNVDIVDLVDENHPAGHWILEQRALVDFIELPSELQDFVCKPINRPFLELAQKLSSLSSEELRSIAEGLLEITI